MLFSDYYLHVFPWQESLPNTNCHEEWDVEKDIESDDGHSVQGDPFP